MQPHQPHRKKVRHFENVRSLHELTFSTYQRLPLLTNDTWLGILARELDAACQAECFELVAFVFIPEHVHLLVLPLVETARVSRLLGRTKRRTSVQIKLLLEANQSPLLSKLTVRERPNYYVFRFWQEGGGFDRNFYEPKAIQSSIDYLHQNPVRQGLCSSAIEWKWSSARYYLQEVVDVDLPRISCRSFES